MRPKNRKRVNRICPDRARHAGVGGFRNRTISDGISWNTSAADAAVISRLRRQRRGPPAPRPRLQSRQFHADAGDARGGGAVVAHQPAREADQDRCRGESIQRGPARN
jgi:hypothetical protein